MKRKLCSVFFWSIPKSIIGALRIPRAVRYEFGSVVTRSVYGPPHSFHVRDVERKYRPHPFRRIWSVGGTSRVRKLLIATIRGSFFEFDGSVGEGVEAGFM